MCGFLLTAFLWFCIWGTYNTDMFRIFNPDFPHNTVDLIHGLRSFLPFVAVILAIAFLLKKRRLPKNFFLTPLGLLSLYAILGVISSVLSKNSFMALYWAVLYGFVIIVLLAISAGSNPLKKLSFIINVNWVIAGIIALGLLVFFLIQPGALSSLTVNFLICSQRPYEGLGGVPAEMQTLGMAGTRPTGLGRYAGVIAIITFVNLLYIKKGKKLLKFVWFFLFILFLCILLFSKGKTEIVGFIIAIISILWLRNKFKTPLIFGVGFIILLSGFIIFYNVPCTNSISLMNPFVSKRIATPTPTPTPTPYATPLTLKSIKSISTLSGRTIGAWSDSWHLFLSSPLLGYGFHADRIFLEGQHAHNALLHALIQTGLFGTIPFVLAFILTLIILRRLFKRPDITGKDRSFLIGVSAVLVFFAVRSITESVAFFSADWLFVVPIIAYIQYLDNQIKIRQKIKRQTNKKETRMDFLGIKINTIKMSEVLEKMSFWIKNEPHKLHWIVVTGMHGIVEAEKHADFKYIISNADLFVPDGISLIWFARCKGIIIKKRIGGADLMLEFFKTANKQGFTNYFYGDTEDTLQKLNKKLLEKFPNLKIAGSYSPPFRELTKEENKIAIENINKTNPNVLWVGLGLPKQEKWIFAHREKLNVPVVIGVGASFKFLSGKIKRVPKWIGDAGFEWLWRLFHEPRIIWRRVFLCGPSFIWLVILELIRFKSYKE